MRNRRISTSRVLSRLTSAFVTVLLICFVAVAVMADGQVKLSFQGETQSNSGVFVFNVQFDGYKKDEDIKFSFYAKDSSGNAINKKSNNGDGARVGGGNGQDSPKNIAVKIDNDGKINVTISKDSWTRKNNQTPLTIYGSGISGYTSLKYEKSKGDNPPPPGPGPDDPKPKDPTATPVPTATAAPTNTPVPTKPAATNTPVPTKPAATATPVPTKAESSGGDNAGTKETAASTAPTTQETSETTLAAVIISDVTNTPKPKHKATNTPSPKKDDKKDNKKDDKKKDDKKPTPTTKPIAVVTAAPTETTKKSEETTTETTAETTEATTEATAEGQVSETAAAETSETSETSAETSEETTESSYVAAAVVRQWATEDPNKTTFNPLWLLLILILLIVAGYLRYRQLKNKGYKGNDIALYFIPGTYMTVEGILNSFSKKDKKAPVVAYPETGSTKTGGYNPASAMKELSKMEAATATAVGKSTETVNSTAFKAPIKRPKPQSSAPTRPAASAAVKKPAAPAPASAAAPAAAAGLLGKKKDKEQTVEAYPVTKSTTATTNYAAQMKALKQEEEKDMNIPSPFKPASSNKEPEKASSPAPAAPAATGLAGLFGKKKDKEKPVEAYPQTKSTTATTNYAAQMKALKQEEDKAAEEEAKPAGFTGQRPAAAEKTNPGSKFSSTNKSKFSSGGNRSSTGGDTMNRPDKGFLNMNATPTAASASFRNNFRGGNQAPTPSLATQPIPPVKEKKVVEEKKSPFKQINVEDGPDSTPANNLTKRDDNGNPLVVNGYLQKSNTTPIRPVAREKSPSGVFSGIVRPGSKDPNPEPTRKQTPVAAALTKSNEPSALKAEDLFITEEPKKINPFKPIDPSKIDPGQDSAEKA